MKKMPVLVVLAIGFTTPALAATRTITLAVPGMTCAACPITVKMALANVAGVKKIHVRYEQREAIIIFDDTQTQTDTLIRATGNAGYPSTLKP